METQDDNTNGEFFISNYLNTPYKKIILGDIRGRFFAHISRIFESTIFASKAHATVVSECNENIIILIATHEYNDMMSIQNDLRIDTILNQSPEHEILVTFRERHIENDELPYRLLIFFEMEDK